MKARKHDNAKLRMLSRQVAAGNVDPDKGRKLPGSMNPKKGTAVLTDAQRKQVRERMQPCQGHNIGS